MAVKIRLARRGRKKLAMYDVVVAQSRSPRDGVFIEKIGTYNPLTNPATINLREDKALDWLMKGAQPSDTVRAMLSYKGILIRKHLQIGVIKGAITQEEADKRFQEWKAIQDNKINAKIERLAGEKETSEKERHANETKVNESRAAALRQKQAARLKEEASQRTKETAAEQAPASDTPSPVGEATPETVESAPEVITAEAQPEAPVQAEPESAVQPDEPANAPE